MLSLYKGFIKYLVSYLKILLFEMSGMWGKGTCKLYLQITRYELKIFSYYLTNCTIMK